jgi:hypothetical protein
MYLRVSNQPGSTGPAAQLSPRHVVLPAHGGRVILPAKQPNEVLDYVMDWRRRLYGADEFARAIEQEWAGQPVTITPADQIARSQFTLPPGITATASENTATQAKIWLSGGADGEIYEIRNEIVTAGGRTMNQTVRIRIRSK